MIFNQVTSYLVQHYMASYSGLFNQQNKKRYLSFDWSRSRRRLHTLTLRYKTRPITGTGRRTILIVWFWLAMNIYIYCLWFLCLTCTPYIQYILNCFLFLYSQPDNVGLLDMMIMHCSLNLTLMSLSQTATGLWELGQEASEGDIKTLCLQNKEPTVLGYSTISFSFHIPFATIGSCTVRLYDHKRTWPPRTTTPSTVHMLELTTPGINHNHAQYTPITFQLISVITT